MPTYPVGAYFVTPVPGVIGWLIRLGQRLAGDPSVYCHAGIITDADGTTMEAQPGGARPGNIAHYPQALICDGPILSLPVEKRDVARQTVRHFALMERGTPYSALDYAALACLHLGLPSRGIRRRVQSSGHAICSQLVDLVYQDAGIRLWNDPNRLPGDVMPADLARWALAWTERQEAAA